MDTDWGAVKLDYLSAPATSLRKMAEKHGVPRWKITSRSKREGWGLQRDLYQADLARRRAEALLDEQVKTSLEIRQELLSEGSALRRRMRQIMEGLDAKDARAELVTEHIAKAWTMVTDRLIVLAGLGSVAQEAASDRTGLEAMPDDELETIYQATKRLEGAKEKRATGKALTPEEWQALADGGLATAEEVRGAWRERMEAERGAELERRKAQPRPEVKVVNG